MTRFESAHHSSAGQLRRQVWLKWRCSRDPAVRALAAAQLAGQTPPGLDDIRSPLFNGLAALAAREFPTAESILESAAQTGNWPECLIALADLRTMRGDLTGAIDLATQGVDLRPVDPVAILGATAALADRDPVAALNRVHPLHTERPDDRIVTYYYVSALLRRCDQVASADRDGRPSIISARQLAECKSLVAQATALGGGDTESAAALASLTEEVRQAEVPTWLLPGRGASVGLLALFLVLAVAGIVLGARVSLAILVGSVLFGFGVVAMFVLTHRRPLWELRALAIGAVALRSDD